MNKQERYSNSYSTISRHILSAIFLFALHQNLFAQEADSATVRRTGTFAGLGIGSGRSEILMDGILSLSGLAPAKKNGVVASIDIGHFFSGGFGISTGVSYTNFRGETNLGSYQNKFNAKDSENESYERRVTGYNIKELQNIGILGIPVTLLFRLPLGRIAGISFQTGVNAGIPIQKKYDSRGTFTYKGYYPAYNVLLENLPQYGFPSNAAVRTESTPELQPLWLEVTASAGIDFFPAKKFQVLCALNYSHTLTDISGYTLPEKFQLTVDTDHINSMMGGSSRTSAQFLGIKISLRYYLAGNF